MTFEGFGDQQEIGDFYISNVIRFSSDALALIDSDAGGSGNIGGEPSPNTVLF